MARAKAKLVVVQDLAQKVTSNVEFITPEIAAEWLLLLDENRKYSDATGAAYARDMDAEGWVITNASIGFREDGKLIDGQHRLRACVNSGRPFWSVVVRGLPFEAQYYIDCHRSRSFADQLAFDGNKAAVRMAAAARVLWGIKLGPNVLKRRSSRAELRGIINRHAGLEQSCLNVYSALALRPAMLAALHYIGKDLLDKPEQADAFATAFVRGEAGYKGCAAIALREMLVRDRLKGVRMANNKMLFTAIHVWNLFCTKQPLDWKAIPENPEIAGLDLARV